MSATPTNGSNGNRQPRGAAPIASRTLPHNLDIEASILGGVILRNDVLGALTDIESGTFYDARHRAIWDAVRNLESRRQPIDVVTLEREIEKAGKLDAIGGIGYLGELALRVPTAENILHYAAEARVMQRNRLAIFELGAALERAYSWPHDPGDLISETVGQLSRLEHEGSAIGEKQRTRWYTDLDTFLGDAEPDDDDAVDWVIRDMIPRGEPFLWGGPMKAGKTWAAIDLAISIALGEKWLGAFDNTLGAARVLLVLLEDNERRVRKRLWELCRARNISPNDPRLRANLKITRSSLHLPDPVMKRRFITETKQWEPAVIIVDNLTRVLEGDPNSTKDAAAFARDWVEICDETKAALGFLHHMKKPSGDQKTQDLFDQLRGSNDFGACARNIIVMSPLRNEGEHLSEVRMRGNLDLKRDSFVLGFERLHLLERWRARISDRGDVQDTKSEISKRSKDNKNAAKQRDAAAELERRRMMAIELCRRDGHVSQASLAIALGMSPNSMRPVMELLVSSGVMKGAGKRGYEFVDPEPSQISFSPSTSPEATP